MNRTLPAAAGIGLKAEHYHEVLAASEAGEVVAQNHDSAAPATNPPASNQDYVPAWLEVHPQNYFHAGGPSHHWLSRFAERFPLSFHSVGLSLGSSAGLNEDELEQLAKLCDRYEPAMVSDHLSWSGSANNRLPDLLPVPYTAQTLAHFTREITRVQERLGRSILIENPSRYLVYSHDEMDEVEFLHLLCESAGCGILLDINNVDVSTSNMAYAAASAKTGAEDGDDAALGDNLGDSLGDNSALLIEAGLHAEQAARDYLARIDPKLVGEIHLAGHATENWDDGPLLIDDHGSAISDYCWELFIAFINRSGPRPVLIERDSNIPIYAELRAEAAKADQLMHSRPAPSARTAVPQVKSANGAGAACG